MKKRYLLTKNFQGTASELIAIGEPFCDKILFRRDGVVEMDGKDVKWTRWQEVGGEIPPEAMLIETEAETHGNGLAF